MAIAASVVDVVDYGPIGPCPDCGANPDGDPDDTITVCRCHEVPIEVVEEPPAIPEDEDVQTACTRCGRVRVAGERRCPAPCYGEQKSMTRAERNALD